MCVEMRKILVTDDDSRIRQAIREIVTDFADCIYEAADGREAVAVCEAERPEWVLMDLRMKPLDGLRATAEIKAHFPETQVVIVSQYDDPGLRAQAAQTGACAYVVKENLLELSEILKGARAPEGKREADSSSEVPPGRQWGPARKSTDPEA